MELRTNAVLLDGLIQCFDFANIELGIRPLKQLAQSQEQRKSFSSASIDNFRRCQTNRK